MTEAIRDNVKVFGTTPELTISFISIRFPLQCTITSFPASIKLAVRLFMSPGKADMEISSLIKRPENFISLRIISIIFFEVLAAVCGSIASKRT